MTPLNRAFLVHTVGAGTIFSVLFSCFVGCHKDSHAKTQEPPQEVIVHGTSMVVSESVWPQLVKCQGSLIADEVTVVGAKVAGRVIEIPVDLGDKACVDEVLVQVDPKEFKLLADQADAQLVQARAAVGLKPDDPLESLNPDNAPPVREARAVWEESQHAVERIRKLSSRDAVSISDLDLAESTERVAAARYSSAQNSVREKIALISVQSALKELAYEHLAETKVRAPFTGVVEAKHVATGAYVQTGQALITIAKSSKLRFRGSVPERYAQQLKLGQHIELEFDLTGQRRSLQISRISPGLDPLNRSLVFEADIDNSNGELQSGLFAEGVIQLDPEAKAIVVPVKSLVRFAGVDKVWKIVDGKVKEQTVMLGRQEGDRIEVRSGIEVGDELLQDANEGKPGRFESKS